MEKRSRCGEGREAEQTITEVFAVWAMLEIQCDSHQSETFLDATEEERLLHKANSTFESADTKQKIWRGGCWVAFVIVSLSCLNFPQLVVEAGAREQS